VQDSKILLYYGHAEVGMVKSTGQIRSSGTRISIPLTTIDSMVIVITKLSGTAFGRRLAGLAEVETVARIH
jgi:hypothetical protein